MWTAKKSTFCTAIAVTVLCLGLPAVAAEPPKAVADGKIIGVPYVQDSGVLSINGREVNLWGIERLAPDQQCWQAEMAWCCGEYAAMALKHFVQGRMVECEIKEPAAEGLPAFAICTRNKGQNKTDIAEHLVSSGWALAKKDIAANPYEEFEEDARENKRGAWSSRFQSAQDWRDGIQRFISESGDDRDDDSAQSPTEDDDAIAPFATATPSTPK
jgi:endonuclease YncB( thermonuclease family)